MRHAGEAQVELRVRGEGSPGDDNVFLLSLGGGWSTDSISPKVCFKGMFSHEMVSKFSLIFTCCMRLNSII